MFESNWAYVTNMGYNFIGGVAKNKTAKLRHIILLS
jgi:hypothetical protein